MIYIKKLLILFLIPLIFTNINTLAFITGDPILIPSQDIITSYKASDAAKYSHLFRSIRANENNKFINTRSEIAIDNIKFTLNKDVSDLKITLIKPTSFKQNFTFPEGFIYQIFEVIFKDLEKSDFQNGILRFKIPKSWLTQKGFTDADVKFLKYNDGNWQNINIQYIKQENLNYIFDASLDSFSFFAILVPFRESTTKTLQEEEIILPPNLCGNSIIDINENCLTCPQDSPCKPGEICNYGTCIISQENQIQEPNIEYPSEILQPETNKKSYFFYIISLGVVILGLLIAFLIYLTAVKNRKASLRIPNQEKEFQLLKRYIEEFKQQGYTIEEIKIGALRSNWPENLVNKALREIK